MIAEAPSLTTDRKMLIEELYKKAFPSVARFVRHRNGSLQDARDIFQDALVIFYEKLAEDKVTVESADAYLSGIARHLWYRKFRQEKELVPLDETGPFHFSADEEKPSKEQNDLLEFLERAGRKCLDLLRAFYYDRLGMEQIRENFGYKTVRSATVQKFKCLEKIREEVKQKDIHYEDFA